MNGGKAYKKYWNPDKHILQLPENLLINRQK